MSPPPLNWSHPLQEAVGIDPLPLFEAKNSPDGRRYAISGGAHDLGFGPVEHADLVTLERRKTPRSGDPSVEDPKPIPLPPKAHPKIGVDVLDMIEGDDGTPSVDVVVFGPRTEEPLQWKIERRIAMGLVDDRDSYNEHRDELLEEHRAEIAETQAHLSQVVDAVGGEVLQTYAILPGVRARLPKDMVTALADDVIVRGVGTLNAKGAPTSARGLQGRHASQVNQFIDAGYDGHGPSEGVRSDNVVVAILETVTAQGATNSGRFNEDRPSLRTLGGGSFRQAYVNTTNGWRWFCSGSSCGHNDPHSPALSPATHPTQVAGAILGDYEQDQDTSLDAEERQSASGHAPEALYHMFISDNSDGMEAAVDEVIDMSSSDDPPHIINNSYVYYYSQGCGGDDALSRAMNEAYRDGIAVISGAGNDGGSSTVCKTRSPGSALGSFSAGKTWIDHPGRLYSMLLLMGDRQGTDEKRTTGFDHRWGAGRLRARMVASGGMDPPYYWQGKRI